MRIVRKYLRDTQNPFELLLDVEFFNLYRFPKPLCKNLIDEISPLLVETLRKHAIPSYLKILCALRFFGTGSFQRSVGQDAMSMMSQTSVSRVVTNVAEALNKVAHKYIRFPTGATIAANKQNFFGLHQFPGIVGLIDGTHIRICAPPNQIEHVYYCRKGGHSKNVQIVCDANYLILNVNAKFGGTAHDAYIWRRSILRQQLEETFRLGERELWLLGDSGYPLQPWLLTPVLNPATEGEELYNIAHKKTRASVERCIGVLKSRWRCLSKERVLYYSPEKAGKIINGCVVLHNILIKARVPMPENIENEIENEEDEQVPRVINDSNRLNEARQIQQQVIREYFSR